MLKAFVIRLDREGKDLGDVIQIARSLGQQAFKTKDHVKVKRVYGPDDEIGYVAVVEGPPLDSACSKLSAVRGTETKLKNG